MRTRSVRWMKPGAIVTFLVLGNWSCNKNIDANANRSYMEVTNASPGVSPIYVFFNGAPLGMDTSGIAIDSTTGSAENHYLSATAGIHNLKISSGATDFVNGNTALTSGRYYSVFTYDTSTSGGLKVLILQDEFSLVPDTSAAVRFLNLAPDTTSYAILMTNAVDTFSFGFVPFVGSSPNPGPLSPFYYYVTQGQYGVVAYTDSVHVVALDSLTIVGGKTYSLYTTGAEGSPTDSLAIHALMHN